MAKGKRRVGKRQTFAQKVRAVQMNQTETKRKEAASYTSELLTNSAINLALHDISSGDTLSTRDGEEVYFRSVYARLTLALGASATTAQVVRFILYHPYQQNDIMSAASYLNYIEPERYQVFMDKIYTVNSDSPIKIVKIAKKFYNKARQGLKMHWTSGTGTDISRGALYLCIVSDQASGATNPQLNGRVNVFYKDP